MANNNRAAVERGSMDRFVVTRSNKSYALFNTFCSKCCLTARKFGFITLCSMKRETLQHTPHQYTNGSVRSGGTGSATLRQVRQLCRLQGYGRSYRSVEYGSNYWSCLSLKRTKLTTTEYSYRNRWITSRSASTKVTGITIVKGPTRGIVDVLFR